MSRSDRRRMRSHIAAMAALVLIAAASLALSVANARLTSSTIRAALLPVITALSQEEAIDTTDLLPDGVTPPPPVAQAIERAALAYLASSGSRREDMVPLLIMMGADTEMGRIVADEMSGWVELTVRTAIPGTHMLRRAEEDLALDLEATRQVEARDAVRRQLKALSHTDEDPMSLFRGMMMEGVGPGTLALTDLALSRQMQAEFHVEQVRATDDRAIVQVERRSDYPPRNAAGQWRSRLEHGVVQGPGVSRRGGELRARGGRRTARCARTGRVADLSV